MAARRSSGKGNSGGGKTPKEIPMTDLGWSEDGEPPNNEFWNDSHAAGTPGGGTASGGLAGSNSGRGDPDDVDLEGALGSGVLDTGGDDKGGPPYSGDSGGAVGGTPAQKRAQGGRKHGGLSPEGTHRGDSTIGSNET
ncbi:MAG TPA: hypothetical protein VNX28_16875 [Gemmataceae bacterium]|nr:hypothetical protein [Gemmataceae bacterium]